MQELDDIDLLRDYAGRGSEEAFATLVTRHINKVYSVALRHTGNPHQAAEITQAVFVILARKSPHLRQGVILSGWLYQTARLTAVTFIRGEIRRARREQEAYMRTVLNENESEVWTQIAPLLDTAMAGLNEKERHAIVLRFFDGKSLKEIGAALGASEDTARMRVNRALEKLRKFFTKGGVSSTTAIIAGTISVNSVQAAPITLAKSVTAVAIAKGATASASTLTLVSETMKMMTWLKIKLVIGIGVAVLLAGATAAIALSSKNTDDKTDPAAIEILGKVFDKYNSLTNYQDTGVSVEETSGQKRTNTFSIQLGRPNLYRIEWKRETKDNFDGAIWSSGAGDFVFLTDPKFPNNPKLSSQSYKQLQNLDSTLDRVGNLSGGAAWTIPPLFFGHRDDGLGLLGQSSNFQKQDDEKIGDVDCYVLAGHLKVTRDLPVTLWIGKNDFLIRQSRRTSWTGGGAIQISRTATPEEVAAANKELLQLNANSKQRALTNTETHENIVANQSSAKKDFIYEVPNGLKLEK